MHAVEVLAGEDRWVPVAVCLTETAAREGMDARQAVDCLGSYRVQPYERTLPLAERVLREAAPAMAQVLDDLEDALDDQIYPLELREDFNASDDREYRVLLTAKLWRAIGRALNQARPS